MNSDQLEVRLIVEEQLSAGMGGGAAAPGASAGHTGMAGTKVAQAAAARLATLPEGFREKVAREAERIRRRREDDKEEKSKPGWVETMLAGKLAPHGGALGSLISTGTGKAQWLAGKLGLGDEAVKLFGKIGAFAKGAVAEASVVQQYGPAFGAAVGAVVGKALGLPEGVTGAGSMSDKFFDEVSNWISDKLQTFQAAMSAAGDTLKTQKAAVRLGGTASIDQAGKDFAMFHAVAKQRGELEDRFTRDINKDLARQITRLALGN